MCGFDPESSEFLHEQGRELTALDLTPAPSLESFEPMDSVEDRRLTREYQRGRGYPAPDFEPPLKTEWDTKIDLDARGTIDGIEFIPSLDDGALVGV